MDASEVRFPEKPCNYEDYDPDSLTPLSISTCTRLMELDWSSDTFNNKTVLDIQCNSGILSLYANKLGAASVRSIDVKKTAVEFFTSVVSTHSLPISVEQLDLDQLDASEHAADIVLFMQVLHRLFDQGYTIDDTLYKLATLTNDTLFLETPWEIAEPSETTIGNLQDEQYSIQRIVSELNKYFDTVQLIRFMTDFDYRKDSKRILIKASGKRSNLEAMRHLHNTNVLDRSLSRGNNAIQLMSSPTGARVLKKLPPEAMLPLLDDGNQRALFDSLRKSGSALLPPEPFGDTYIIRNGMGENVMCFPFAGRLSDHFPSHRPHAPVKNPLKLAVECRRALCQLPEDVIQAVRDMSPPISLKPQEDLGELFNRLIQEAGLAAFIDDVYAANDTTDRQVEDSVVHNDLQLGNMISDASGREWIIDMDIMRSGTPYSDFICCAIYNNCDEQNIVQCHAELVEINKRSMQASDMHFAMKMLLRWIYELNRNHKPALAELAAPAVSGMRTLHGLLLSDQKKDLQAA